MWKPVGSNTMDADGTDKEIFSDTPQAKLKWFGLCNEFNGFVRVTVIRNKIPTDNTTGSTTGTGKVTTTDDYVQTFKGFDGMKYASDVYKDMRESLSILTN